MENKGVFKNTVKVEWVEGTDRLMMLMEDICYIDKFGVKWNGFKGDLIDGASIPRFFWRVIGSPFVGRYRRASVIHDVYCTKKTRPFKRVHAVFNEMMITDNVPKVKRVLMAKAVKRFGPRW